MRPGRLSFPSIAFLFRSFPAAALLLALVACGAPSVTRPDEVPGRAGPTPLVVALGDSLTDGPGLRREDTYPARLQERVDARGYPHRLVNAGVSGDTTSGGVRRLEAALVPGTRVLIVALGANDGLGGVPVEQVRTNLSQIIETALQRNIKVLLTGMETPPTRGWQYTLEFHMIFPELAAQYNVPLMPFLLTGVVGDAAYNLADGIHPNAQGARRIAENMWPYLEPLLIETTGG